MTIRKMVPTALALMAAAFLAAVPPAVASAPTATAAAKTCKKEKRAVKRADSKKETRKAKKALRKCRKANRPAPAPAPAPEPAPTPPPTPAPAPVETVLSKERAQALTDAYAKQLFDAAVATAATPDEKPVRYQTEAPDTCDRIDDRTVDCSFGLFFVSSIPVLAGQEIICVNMHRVLLLSDGTIEEENEVLGCE